MVCSNILKLKQVILPEEYGKIDTFCGKHMGLDNLQKISDFLKLEFSFDLITDPDIVKGYCTDSSNHPGDAQGLVRPKNKRECAIIFRACYMAGIQMTISAGKSNLTGSATPKNGVVISTAKLTKPEPLVDKEMLKVSTPTGLILEDLREYVVKISDNTLIFPVDPTSRKDCAVGGALACNASGFNPGENGSMRKWVKSVDIIFPNGLLLEASRGQYLSENGLFIIDNNGETSNFPVPHYDRPTFKNASGPFSSKDGIVDIVDLAIGSEGIFGLVTNCTLALSPKPDNYLDFFFSLPEENNAIAFYHYLHKKFNGDFSNLTAFEYFGLFCRKYMDHENKLFHGKDQAGIYLQIPLTGKNVDDAINDWFEILINSDCNINDDAIILMDNDKDRSIFFEARHSLAANTIEIVQQKGTFITATDTIVPPKDFTEFVNFGNKLIQNTNIDYLLFGHLGDCHLHFQILPDKKDIEIVIDIYDKIIDKSTEFGGVYSAEHGTGKRKRKDFIKCYGNKAVEQVLISKQSIDPKMLLNRGNVVEYIE